MKDITKFILAILFIICEFVYIIVAINVDICLWNDILFFLWQAFGLISIICTLLMSSILLKDLFAND